MTLIVGRAVTREQIYLFADTEITYRNEERRPITNGCLKLYRLGPHLALGFSGDVADFREFLPTVRDATAPEQVLIAAEVAYANGSRFDVLVAGGGSEHIHILKSGIRQTSSAGFIGDAPAYGKYQEILHRAPGAVDGEVSRASMKMHRLPEPVDEKTEQYSRMFHSFFEVVESRDFPSVGGVGIPLCTDNGDFTYMNYAGFVSDILRVEDFTEEPKPVTIGTAEGGGYAFEFSPASGDPSVIGFYIPPAGFGAVFQEDAWGMKWARLIEAPTPAHWCLESRAIVGHSILSGFLTGDNCGQAAEQLLMAHRFDDAIFCYELRKESTDFDDRPAVRDRFFLGYSHALASAGRTKDAIAVLLSRADDIGFSSSSAALLEQLRLAE